MSKVRQFFSRLRSALGMARDAAAVGKAVGEHVGDTERSAKRKLRRSQRKRLRAIELRERNPEKSSRLDQEAAELKRQAEEWLSWSR